MISSIATVVSVASFCPVVAELVNSFANEAIFAIFVVFPLIFPVISSKEAAVSSKETAVIFAFLFKVSTFERSICELFCRLNPIDLFSISILVISFATSFSARAILPLSLRTELVKSSSPKLINTSRTLLVLPAILF